MRRLKLLSVLPIFFAASVAAMSFSSLIKQAEVIKVNAVTAVTNSAISVSTTIRGFAANDPYMIKNLTVPKATFMTRFKAGFGGGGIGGLVKKNAWYAGWMATMAAAGWAIDELTEQVVQPSPEYFEGYYFITTSFYAGQRSSTYVDSCKSYISVISSAYSSTYVYHSSTATVCRFYAASAPANILTDNTYKRACDSSSTSVPSCSGFPAPSVVVPDDAIFDSLATEMLKDPDAAAQAFMVPDPWPYPYPQVFPDTVPYIPGVAESDEEALNWYLQGLAQSTDPNAAYYVAPERLQQIAALAQQLQQAQSPEGQVADLNENLKSPLTQSQLEETMKKQDEALKKDAETIAATDQKPITDAYKDSGTKDEFDKLKERVSDPSKMPQLPSLPAADEIDLPIHQPCRTITMNMMNGVLTFPNPDQCAKLEQVKTGLGYLLYVLTALGIVFELYRRVE